MKQHFPVLSLTILNMVPYCPYNALLHVKRFAIEITRYPAVTHVMMTQILITANHKNSYEYRKKGTYGHGKSTHGLQDGEGSLYPFWKGSKSSSPSLQELSRLADFSDSYGWPTIKFRQVLISLKNRPRTCQTLKSMMYKEWILIFLALTSQIVILAVLQENGVFT